MHYIGVNLSKTTPLPSDRESEFFIYRLNSKVHVAMYRVSQKTWEFSDEFDIVFVMN